MCPLTSAPPVAAKTKFSAVDAARLALAGEPLPTVSTTRQRRVARVASTMWCRDLQFPTVRELGRELGLSSSSSVTAGFGRLIDVQAVLIRREWAVLEHWSALPPDDRAAALKAHADRLANVDPVRLRLPGLVWSAVATADPGRIPTELGVAAPLHALAAFVDAPSARAGGFHG
jgi:hypothetical protein